MKTRKILSWAFIGAFGLGCLSCGGGGGNSQLTSQVKQGIDLIGQGNPAAAKTQFLSELARHPDNDSAHYGVALSDGMLAADEISTAAEMLYSLMMGLAQPSSVSPGNKLYSRPGQPGISSAPVTPMQLDPATLINLYLDPVVELMAEMEIHLQAINLDNFKITMPSVPVRIRFDQEYLIDIGGEADEFEVRLAGVLTGLVQAAALIIKSLNLNIDPMSLLSGLSFPLDVTGGPVGWVSLVRKFGPVLAGSPDLLKIQDRDKFSAGLAKLNATMEWVSGENGSLFSALLKKDGTDPLQKVFGFVDENHDGVVGAGDRVSINPVRHWNVTDAPWCSDIYLPKGTEDLIPVIDELVLRVRKALRGEDAVLDLAELNAVLAFPGFGEAGKLHQLPNLARVDLKKLFADFPDPRAFFPATDTNGEFQVELEIGTASVLPLIYPWETAGDGPHFGQAIPADGITVPDSSPAGFLVYLDWSDPSFNGALQIRESLSENGNLVTADKSSINALIALLVNLYSRWMESVFAPVLPEERGDPGFEDYVFPVREEAIEADGDVLIQNVFFTNREEKILGGRLYWPDSATTTAKVPGIVFNPGTICWLDTYHWIAMDLSRNGYAVFVFEPGGQAESEGDTPGMGSYWFEHYLWPGWENDLYDAVTYLYKVSPISDRVDADKLGIMGHSRGSMAVCNEQVNDYRVKAAVEVSMTLYFCSASSRVPTQIQSADFDLLDLGAPLVGPIGNEIFYDITNPPKQVIIIGAASHGGFNTIEGEGADSPFRHWPLVPEWEHPVSSHYALAWFDYFLKGDTTARSRITEYQYGLSQLFTSRYLLDPAEGEIKMRP
ncbi:MAG: hypothetical protein PHE84_02610 [bacterium]|nr:hypothetical protein [bacterium]